MGRGHQGLGAAGGARRRWLALACGAGLALPAWAAPGMASPDPSGEGAGAAVPDVAHCRAGAVAADQAARALAVLNDIRVRHGLATVAWDEALAPAVQQAALMLAANRRLSHSPTPAWFCHTAAGARGAALSNLHLAVDSEGQPVRDSGDVIVGFLTDVHNQVAGNLGHRRWLLDPFLQRVAYGQVAWARDGLRWTAAALSVVAPQASGADDAPAWGRASRGYVAWPEGDYPARYADPRAWLSFAAVVDLGSRAANLAVDYGAVRLSVRREDGRELPVAQWRSDHAVVGLPNHLQFRVPGIEPGVEHVVQLDDVRVDGQSRVYRYRFRIVP